MAINASEVKALRERTGAGMMECKKALQAADGDLEAAAENMRREGMAKADKKAGRVAAEGLVVAPVSDDGRRAMLVEVNCETDFVASNDDFVAFANAVADKALAEQPADLEALGGLEIDGQSIETRRREVIAKIGENVTVRRMLRVDAGEGVIATYRHGGLIGSVVAVRGGDAELARDLAMHVAASAPQYTSADDVPAERRESERAALIEQARESGKPDDIIEKMVEGRLRKYLGEITLMGQPFVKDPDQTVEQLLQAAGAEVTDYARVEVGEGVEKAEEDFAAEVKAQAEGTA